ncbi:MAG: enterochelin esterase-like enzyme, partial [Gemmatimonadetes bacterium]|nr:enterochelin esterase-like enzyme [Gemmatimonadota bacterium]
YSEEAEGGRGRSAGFSEFWRSAESPKLILVTVRDANPYYDTGHSVNSVNVGPYGDAFVEELIPHLESRFRIIPEGWARILAGGSTGGWEALAIQILNPAEFGGAWGWCPDPVDFHYYQIVNIYEDENAYWSGTEWVRVERPNARQPDGNVTSTILQENSYERAVGPNGRSGGQWAIWEAIFSPVGTDGYAAPIWDRVTGEIHREVAEYWRENWDLTHYLTENWNQVGPSLAGKLHIATGDMDSYYLNNAVELMEQALGSLSDPYPDASFEYGRKRRHCWIGESPWRPGEDLSNAEFVRVVSDYWRERGGTW